MSQRYHSGVAARNRPTLFLGRQPNWSFQRIDKPLRGLSSAEL